MACKKSELISAINSYVAARLTGDSPLINAAAAMLQPALDSLDYASEEEPVVEGEAE
jgi:spore coat polysaccharide biosynthesis protein SpsF (cytidylyltransferase family)